MLDLESIKIAMVLLEILNTTSIIWVGGHLASHLGLHRSFEHSHLHLQHLKPIECCEGYFSYTENKWQSDFPCISNIPQVVFSLKYLPLTVFVGKNYFFWTLKDGNLSFSAPACYSSYPFNSSDMGTCSYFVHISVFPSRWHP